MCGIAGYVGKQSDAADFLIEALQRLEYRGYDSAGVALLSPKLDVLKVTSRVGDLKQKLDKLNWHGNLGIAHTRWATHGKPCIENAHPHLSGDQLAIVHNGIIENYVELKEFLQKKNYAFKSETDSEVIAHLIHYYKIEAGDLLLAVQSCIGKLEGAYGMVVCDEASPDRLIVARKGSPLIIGHSKQGNYIASDIVALSGYADKVTYLEDGDIAVIQADDTYLFDSNQQPVTRQSEKLTSQSDPNDKKGFAHFMLKEIYEQPETIYDTCRGMYTTSSVNLNCFGQSISRIVNEIEVIQIIACGTSYNAGLVAKNWIESISGKLCLVDVASEFRYRTIVMPKNTLVVAISQSGETADTLSALEFAKSQQVLSTLAICNVPTSALVRQTDGVFLTSAGPEIGVASTKAFSSQLVGLFLLAIYLQNHLPHELIESLLSDLNSLPQLAKIVLTLDKQVQQIAPILAKQNHALFLGRGLLHPIAIEGALKLKEISYIHAEAYPAGELKHGPLALVDESIPVIFLVPDDELIDKVKSNIQEVLARGGQIIILSEFKIIDDDRVTHLILPKVAKSLAPFIYNMPLQLLAYFTALCRGTDIDKPRNLAKSVTVE